MNLLYDLSFSDIASLLAEWGEPSYRASQIWQGLYQQFWDSSSLFTQLPKRLRTKLGEYFRIDALTPVKESTSKDKQTVKSLFRLHDGPAIEAVLMRFTRGNTLCISTQSGCAMGCVFCATGQMGFKRHLSSGEIVAQVMYYARWLHAQNEMVTNVVVMGMGEPFHNYENTMAAIDRLNHPFGYNFGARRFTISTVGLVPAIRRFAAEKRQINLAISLHAADDTLRTSIVPINKKYPLDELLAACGDYVSTTGRRITFEWALIRGVNDMPEQAHLLAGKIHKYFDGDHRGRLYHVNIISLNPTPRYPGQATTYQRAEAFRDVLEQAGVPCTIRLRRGIEIHAGCGQLAYLV
jgi:23S rRNA (adenine2503-C2)-methyltransferase